MAHNSKVLVVDDSEFQADFMESALEDLGISNIAKANDGSDALKQFKSALEAGERYAIVFLDIVMPEMDGQEALKQMRAMEKEAGIGNSDKTTIIMTTALSSPDDMLTALLEGDCSDYVVKPVAESILKAMLVKYGLLPA